MHVVAFIFLVNCFSCFNDKSVQSNYFFHKPIQNSCHADIIHLKMCVEQTKVKYTHSRTHQETPLNIDLGSNNKRQVYKIGTVWGVLGRRGRVNEEVK
jgi:hypothetical protein